MCFFAFLCKCHITGKVTTTVHVVEKNAKVHGIVATRMRHASWSAWHDAIVADGVAMTQGVTTTVTSSEKQATTDTQHSGYTDAACKLECMARRNCCTCFFDDVTVVVTSS